MQNCCQQLQQLPGGESGDSAGIWGDHLCQVSLCTHTSISSSHIDRWEDCVNRVNSFSNIQHCDSAVKLCR